MKNTTKLTCHPIIQSLFKMFKTIFVHANFTFLNDDEPIWF